MLRSRYLPETTRILSNKCFDACQWYWGCNGVLRRMKQGITVQCLYLVQCTYILQVNFQISEYEAIQLIQIPNSDLTSNQYILMHNGYKKKILPL